MTEKRNTTIMSFRLSDFMREELSKTADQMGMTDSHLIRVAITSAITKFANRNLPDQRAL